MSLDEDILTMLRYVNTDHMYQSDISYIDTVSSLLLWATLLLISNRHFTTVETVYMVDMTFVKEVTYPISYPTQ